MQAKHYLKQYSVQAERFFTGYFAKKKREAKVIDLKVLEMVRSVERSNKGGKKFRGALTVLGYKIAGGKHIEAILPVSCGIELIHNFLLIQDDFIDRDKRRRGKVTLHREYSKKRDEHFGLSMAAVAGDLSAFSGYELITDSDFPAVRVIASLSKLNGYLLRTGYGEVLDIEMYYKNAVSQDYIGKIRELKTVYYTFVMPMVVGATLAGASDAILKLIEKYALPVGLAFQLQDDVLGVFGDPELTGKSNESDIREGINTLLYLKTKELAAGKDKEYLKRWYGARGLTTSRINKIRSIIGKSGSLDFSQRYAKELVETGKEVVSKITKDKKLQEVLNSLADYMVEREK